MGGWVGSEDLGGGLWSGDDTNTSVKDIDGIIVEDISDSGSEEGSEGLGEQVSDESDWGELANRQESKGNGWVDMSS